MIPILGLLGSRDKKECTRGVVMFFLKKKVLSYKLNKVQKVADHVIRFL